MHRRYALYWAASAYLLYLVYGLVRDIKSGVSDNVPFSIGIAAFFSAAAVVISLYAWKKAKEEKAEEKKALKEKEWQADAPSAGERDGKPAEPGGGGDGDSLAT